jgi:hypothetical protein
MILYSVGEQGYLTRKGLDGMRSALARDVFRQDLMQVYERQTEHRDDLRREAREILQRIGADNCGNSVVENLLRQLADRLAYYKGKRVYGYLPADAKNLVNSIVDALSRDENITKLYDLWYEQREAVLETYKSDMPERVPLSQNREFRSIKNAVIAATEKLILHPQSLDTKEIQSAQSASTHLIGQLADLFSTKILQEPQADQANAQTDSKLRTDIALKKRDSGLRPG